MNTPSKWNDPFKYNNDNDNESKLLNYLLAQLQYELSIGSPNGPILNKDNINVQDEEVSMEQGHLIKDKFEIYKNLHRKDRIKRLFIVLELVVDLLERDFSIWLSKY